MKKGVIVTNVPANYRIDLYNFIGGKNFKIFFYDFNSKKLEYCRYKSELRFPWAEIKAGSLIKNLMNDRPDTIICINASHVTFICGIYSLLFRKRFIIWWAGTELSEKNIPFHKQIIRNIIFRLANCFFAYSEFAAEYLSGFNINKNKIEVLGNVSFDPIKYYERVNKTKNEFEKDGYVYLLAVGKLIDRKNYGFLLDVYKEIENRYDNVKLIIVGDGPEKERLINKANKNKIRNIEFAGRVSNDKIYPILCRADIFVHTALMDQWPQVVNEALSAKLPVVVSNLSGISEKMFKNEEDIYILDLNKHKFVDIIDKFIRDETLRDNIGQNGFNKINLIWCHTKQLFEDMLSSNIL